MKKYSALDWFIFVFMVILTVYMLGIGYSVIKEYKKDNRVSEHINLR
jgi:hypothetical protein